MAAARRSTSKNEGSGASEPDPLASSAGSSENPAPPEAADAPDAAGAPEAITPEIDADSALRETTDYLKGLFEALLFVADHPVELKELSRAARIDRKRGGEIVALLREEYASRGIVLDEVADGYALRSSPRYASFVRNFLSQRPVRLSRAQLETLSIIAYRQPITRPEIDEIRGVDCGPVLKGLLERDLIKILGKKDEPGRPLLYGTTSSFLELFTLTSLSQLPTLREFTELSDESRRTFAREIGEEAPEGPLPVGSDDGEADGVESEATDASADDPAATSDEDDDDDDDDDDDEDEDDDDD